MSITGCPLVPRLSSICGDDDQQHNFNICMVVERLNMSANKVRQTHSTASQPSPTAHWYRRSSICNGDVTQQHNFNFSCQFSSSINDFISIPSEPVALLLSTAAPRMVQLPHVHMAH
eukprot:TRINITY_DN21064_c0_g1_i1.p2 TRINITY_DN21064_c0_g1~~TRINITY_DN21064_c0_g1_i1.p2  ORF type:complete len:117 (-),score=18.38 TRINITY_DN21064_c0_g1_i1:1161-1511(-)